MIPRIRAFCVKKSCRNATLREFTQYLFSDEPKVSDLGGQILRKDKNLKKGSQNQNFLL